MANTDEDVKTTPTTSADIKSAVENASAIDESTVDDEEEKDESTNSEAEDAQVDDESTEGDKEEEDDSAKTDDDDSKEDPEEDKSDAKKDSEFRFTQFAGDGTTESYISNLEKAYENSSAEGINLNQKLSQATKQVDAIVSAVQADPELKDRIDAILAGRPSAASPKGESAASSDPFLVNAKTQWEEESTKSAQEFINANPEVVSNPEINTEVKKWMEVFSRQEYEDKGKLLTAGEAMKMAYRHLGYEDKREARSSKNGMKSAVAPTKPQGSRKPAKTASDFTESQLQMGEMMGLSKDKLEKFAK